MLAFHLSIAHNYTHSSNFNAIQYPTKTSNVRSRPAGFPKYNAVPRKLIVLPQYIGDPVTLKGKPVTMWSIKMPK